MSDDPSAGTPGPDAAAGAESFAVAEEIARSQAIAETQGAAPTADVVDAHAAERAAHLAAAAPDHSTDPGPGDDMEGLPHAADGHDAHDAHGAADAHSGHGGHGGPALGPIDWKAYGAGLVGAALGLVVAAVLAVTTGYIVL